MQRSLLAVFLLLCALALSAAAAAQVTTITFYDPRPNVALGQIMDELVAEFQEKNPDIRIEHVHISGYNQMNEKILVSWFGGGTERGHRGTEPLVRLSIGQHLAAVRRLHRRGRHDMDRRPVSRHRRSLDLGRQDLGASYNISTPLIYYNCDLFRQSGLEPRPPTTWQEILEFSRRIAKDSDGDGNVDVWGIDFYAWGWLFEAWLGQNGARVASPDGRRYTFNSEEAIEAMEFTQSLVLEHRVARQGTGYPDFWAGRLGMTERSTASLAGNVQQAEANGIDMRVGPLACNKECCAPIGGGNLHILNTGTPEQKEAAWRFVSFLVEPENLARMGASDGYMAGRISSVQSPILQAHFVDERGPS